MKLKLYISLTILGASLGYIVGNNINVSKPNSVVLQDSIIVLDTSINVKNKVALFIGDSHTANSSYGWQKQLSDSVGFDRINTAVSGKMTYWMLDIAVYKMNKSIDYCFIYGGANDMYSSIQPIEAYDNIKSIAKLCNVYNIKCYVLTGFDANKCTKVPNSKYSVKYAKLQELLLMNTIPGATVIDTRVVDKRDCWDVLCHMNKSGHQKIANKIISDLKLKKVTN